MTTPALDPQDAHLATIRESAKAVEERFGKIPDTLVVAGSGLGAFAERMTKTTAASYDDLKNFPQSTVVGHAGKLIVGEAGGRRIVLMSGRKHVYEGVDVRLTVLPLRALIAAGVKTVILSNAAGALNRTFQPGDLMLINDHINMQFRNPLMGPNLDELGPRFPDMCTPYNSELLELARDTARREGIRLHEGVYLALTGPTYETPAEVQMFRGIADAVGMSTVPENTAAVHAGARVLGISAITNSHVLKTGVVTTHEEVMDIGRHVSDEFCRLVEGIIARL